jgi:hypothetical protein
MRHLLNTPIMGRRLLRNIPDVSDQQSHDSVGTLRTPSAAQRSL